MSNPAAPPANTAARLLAAAVELLRVGGGAAASARAICARAGVQAPSLYHHYGDLAGLHRAAVEAAFAESARRKLAAGVEHEPASDPRESIRRGWDAYVDFAREEPALFALVNAQLTAGGEMPAIARDSLAALVERVRALGGRHPLRLTPEAGARMLWAGAHGVACLMAMEPPPAPGSAPSAPGLSEHLREATITSLLHTQDGASHRVSPRESAPR